jgi:diguanylate cyclase
MRAMWSIIPYAAQNRHAAACLRLFPGGRRTRDLLALNGSLEERLAQAAARIATLEHTLSQARRDALTDGLTGLCNRRAFDQALREIAGREDSDGLALLLLDADYFKAINDFHGHPLGDELLRAMGQTIARTIRRTDLAARYGGEEFAVLLPDTDLGGAMSIAEALRANIAASRVDIARDGRQTGVTVSVGVAALEPGEGPVALVSRADAGLYRAKRDGRNCVCAGPVSAILEASGPHTMSAALLQGCPAGNEAAA